MSTLTTNTDYQAAIDEFKKRLAQEPLDAKLIADLYEMVIQYGCTITLQVPATLAKFTDGNLSCTFLPGPLNNIDITIGPKNFLTLQHCTALGTNKTIAVIINPPGGQS